MAVLIGIVGLPAVGKSTFAKKLVKQFALNHVRTDGIREFLKSNFTYYTDADYSHPNPLIASVNRIVRKLTDDLITEFMAEGQSVIVDSAGKTKEKRKHRIVIARAACPDVKYLLIEILTNEEVVLQRLAAREDDNNQRWVETYTNRWKPMYEQLTSDEADFLLVYDGSNEEEILKKVGELLDS